MSYITSTGTYYVAFNICYTELGSPPPLGYYLVYVPAGAASPHLRRVFFFTRIRSNLGVDSFFPRFAGSRIDAAVTDKNGLERIRTAPNGYLAA